MAYRGKYPTRVCSVSSISLFSGLYMLATNAGEKFTVTGRALDAVKDHLKADVSAFPEARKLVSTACERDDNFKPLSVTLVYEDGETVTATPETHKLETSFNIVHVGNGKSYIVNPAPYATFRAARRDRDGMLDALNRPSMHADFQIYTVATCQRSGFAYSA